MDFGTVIAVLGICVGLPLACVCLFVYMKNHETNKRSEILLAAIEKNVDINADVFFKKLSGSQQSLKERILKKLTYGLLFSAVGLGCLCIAIWMSFNGYEPKEIYGILFIAIIPLFVGISSIIMYFISKKELAKELEQEENNRKASSTSIAKQ